jgi:phosphoribosylformylglycinamidine cyclo-ligase
MAKACRENACALLGGETAEMPGFYDEGEYDLAGFIVGLVDRTRVIDGSRLAPGDVLIGIPSTGLHTNGYSLARRIVFDRLGLSFESVVPELGVPIGEALLAIHRSYLHTLLPVIGRQLVKGIAHITGGGITDNLPRILPENRLALIERHSWETPPLFRFLATAGNVPDDEMLRAFNMGIGMIVAADERDATTALDLIREHGGDGAVIIGRIAEGQRGVAYL